MRATRAFQLTIILIICCITLSSIATAYYGEDVANSRSSSRTPYYSSRSYTNYGTHSGYTTYHRSPPMNIHYSYRYYPYPCSFSRTYRSPCSNRWC